jgi:DNA polymerase-3 subunit epsilon
LTGITNEMVSDAPIFDTISDKVLNYCLTVSLAHNVNFDYSFVRHELERAGLNGQLKLELQKK